MLTYKEKKLEQIEAKNAGKNQGNRSGFYRDSTGAEFFVKEPLAKKELFTELLAGFIIEELIYRKLIPAIYKDSLIYADLIQFEDGSYALIQPRIRFTELYKIIQTGYHDNSDRNLFLEMFWGPAYYLLLLEDNKRYFGLSLVLMISLLLGDYSVHSGNVVILDKISIDYEPIKQLARIDWGAAFRYFGYKNNHSDLLNPFEYQGLLNFKGFTKGYIRNYEKFIGLFPAIGEKAKNLMEVADEALFEELISNALSRIPSDLIDDTVRGVLSDYLGMESFNHVEFGTTKPQQQFAIELAQLFKLRLEKMVELKDLIPKGKNSKLYNSMEWNNENKVISEASFRFFPEQIAAWRKRVTQENSFDFTKVSLPFLVTQFNYFLNILLKQGLQYKKEVQLREEPNDVQAEVLRQLFTLTEEASPAFPTPQNLLNENECFWPMVESVLALGVHIVVSLKVLQEMTSASADDSKAQEGAFLLDAIKELLVLFEQTYQPLAKLLGLSEKISVSVDDLCNMIPT